MRQNQLFMAPTKKQNPTTTIRQLPPNAYNFGNQLSRNIPTKHNRATLSTHQHSTFTMLSYTISKMSPVSGSVEHSLQRT
jgi:hypothetical protein